LLAGDTSSRTVKIYAVPQTVLSWSIDEDRPRPDDICPDPIGIKYGAAVPEIM
jgi:hypothetical protein